MLSPGDRVTHISVQDGHAELTVLWCKALPAETRCDHPRCRGHAHRACAAFYGKGHQGVAWYGATIDFADNFDLAERAQ